MDTPEPDPNDPRDPAWRSSLSRVLADPDAIAMHVQPIVDLERGTIVGYESLARFDGPPMASPDRWFAAASGLRLGPELAAVTLARSLARVAELPPDTFLTVNLEPGHAVSDEVRAVLAAHGRLDRVIVEITEHTAANDVQRLRDELDLLRELGARTAIDDAGAGYAGLTALLDLRPDLIKLDRALIADLDRDPARRALLRAVGELADGIDAWVLGEGIETDGELTELVALGVPLGQGYRLGWPAAAFATELDALVIAMISDQRRRRDLPLVIAGIATQAASVHVDAPATVGSGIVVVVDGIGRPVGLQHADGHRTANPLTTKPFESLSAVARRVSTRRDGRWSDPVVVTDGSGRLLRIVEVPRLLDALAAAVDG